MKPTDVYNALKEIGAESLHHANTVTTSCTFLEQAGLASRGFVEDNGLEQTRQGSDAIDKKYEIWHSVFLDHVDIHARGGRTKGANQYGPVLFVMKLELLLALPTNTKILIAKKNPIHWKDNEAEGDRWYSNAGEVSASIKSGDFKFGDFDKMLIINLPSGKLDFTKGKTVRIELDDPERKLTSGKNAYTFAEGRLSEAAAVGKVPVLIKKHLCRSDCCCITKYANLPAKYFDSLFS